MTYQIVIQALKGGSGSGNFGHSGRPGKLGGSGGGMSALAGMEREVKFDGDYLEIEYSKMTPAKPGSNYMVTDLSIGFPYIRGKVKGDALEIRAIGAGNTKRSGIGTAMVQEAMEIAGVTKIASTGVESTDGKAFLDALAARGFQIIGRSI